MRLVSWNVNGVRAAMRKGFVDAAATLDADVLGLQETKASEAKAGLRLAGYHAFWNPGERAGYSGTALFSRTEPLSVRMDMGIDELDTEGRVITAEFDDFFFVTVYTPNASRGLVRLDYRVERWDPAFRAFCKELEQRKPVVFCGDLNVAHQEIDIARPRANRRSPGFTPQERESFTETLEAGFIDTFRHFNPDATEQYSWWSMRSNSRARNVGWRLDYFCVSESLIGRVADARIRQDIHGSDHCPVEITLST